MNYNHFKYIQEWPGFNILPRGPKKGNWDILKHCASQVNLHYEEITFGGSRFLSTGKKGSDSGCVFNFFFNFTLINLCGTQLGEAKGA